MEADHPLANTLEHLFASSPDLVFVQDRRGRFTYVNAAAANLLGFDRLYFLGKTWNDLRLSGDLKQNLTAEFERALTTAQRCSGEIAISTARETRDYEYVFCPVQAEGAIDCLVFTARDITEQKRTEAALRESEAKYRSLFEAASDLILIVDAATYRILDANWSAARQLGYARGELLQLSIHEIEVPLSPSCRATVLQHLETEGSFTYEHHYRRRDNSQLAVEISTQVIEYGDGLAFQSFARDITERKQAEGEIQALNLHLEQRVLQRTAELNHAYEELASEVAERRKVEAALRQQQLFLQNVIDTCPTPIFVKDRQGKFVLVNQAVADAYETTIADLTGKTDADFNPDAAEVQRFRQTDQEVMTSLQPKFIYEETVTAPSGKICWFQTVKQPLLSGGQANHVLVVATDITQRKQMEAALQASQACYQALVEDRPELVCRFLADGTLTYANKAYCQMVGLSRQELLSHRYKMFLLVLDPPVAAQLMATPTPDHPMQRAECQVILPSGGVRWQQWTNHAIFDRQNHLIEYQAIGVDIIPHKQMNNSLPNETDFQIIFEQAAVGIAQLDLSGKWIRINRRFCEILGYDADELLERTVESIIYPADFPIDFAYTHPMLSGQMANYSVNKRYLRKDGQVQWVKLTVSLAHNVEGVPQYWIQVIEAVDEQQRSVASEKCLSGDVP